MFIKIADDFDAAGSEVPVPEPNTCALDNVEHPMAVAINPDNGNLLVTWIVQCCCHFDKPLFSGHLFVADSENGCIVELTSVHQ